VQYGCGAPHGARLYRVFPGVPLSPYFNTRKGGPLQSRLLAQPGPTFLEFCDELCILMLDGWEQSKGIKLEIERAQELKKYTWFIA